MKTNPTVSDQMKRGEFLRSLGMSSAALMAFYCMGTGLTACSSDSDDPTPTTPTTGTGLTGNADASKGAINYTLDLTSSTYSKLKTVGQYVIVGSTIVANASGGTLVALSKTCTHEAGNLEYRLAENDFRCDKHGGLFNVDGTVKAVPPPSAVKRYKTSLSTNGNTLTVTA